MQSISHFSNTSHNENKEKARSDLLFISMHSIPYSVCICIALFVLTYDSVYHGNTKFLAKCTKHVVDISKLSALEISILFMKTCRLVRTCMKILHTLSFYADPYIGRLNFFPQQSHCYYNTSVRLRHESFDISHKGKAREFISLRYTSSSDSLITTESRRVY